MEKKKRTNYSEGYKGKDVFGEMIKGADVATKILKEAGNTIIIYTTRPATDALKDWLKKNNIVYDYINENPDQPKESEGCKLIADIYIDDRGLTFDGWSQWFIYQIKHNLCYTYNLLDITSQSCNNRPASHLANIISIKKRNDSSN